ncbi:hypothetical protein GCM10018790_59090 [Kitasatospora xanthocidica]|nr:hypothetical protein GCM10018790_59090 [Kitasatospora xanthocidica]
MDGQTTAEQGFPQVEQQTAERIGRGGGVPDRRRLSGHGRYRPTPPASVRLCPGPSASLPAVPPFPEGPARDVGQA